MMIGTTTQMITEYLMYSPKKHINRCDNLKPLSHQALNDFTFNNITIHKATKGDSEDWLMNNIIQHHTPA